MCWTPGGSGQWLPPPPAAPLQQSGEWLSGGGACGLSGAPRGMNGGLVFAEHCAEEGKAAVLHPGPLWENTRPPGPLLWATRPRTLSRRSLLPGALTPFATYRAECSEGVRWGNLLHPDLSGRTPGSQARPGGLGRVRGSPLPFCPQNSCSLWRPSRRRRLCIVSKSSGRARGTLCCPSPACALCAEPLRPRRVPLRGAAASVPRKP